MLTTLTSDHAPLTAPEIDRESWEADAGELDPTGIWEGTLTGLLGAGLSEDEGALELQLWRDENGTLTGTMHGNANRGLAESGFRPNHRCNANFLCLP